MIKTLTYNGKIADQPKSYHYWLTKTVDERLAAMVVLNQFVYQAPDFVRNKVDRTLFSSRKHPQ